MLDVIKAFKIATMAIWVTKDRTFKISIEAVNTKIVEIEMVMPRRPILLLPMAIPIDVEVAVDATDLNIIDFITFINFFFTRYLIVNFK